jgi:DNA end-binding protein Ku
MLHTMYYLDEIRDVAEFKPHKDLVNDKELKLAKVLIESAVDKFKPEQYKDTFRENLKKLIEAKAKGKETKPVPEPQVPKVVNIMEALRRSLEAKKPVQRERAPAKKAPRRKRA